ncbi:MAG: CHAT domain-containing protein [candidate division KSB1 bacterium]|nr:CHAT domain-containing protein [candidate division KSB1 bacterium]MDZ7303326.1 CHAT domain-containing protein [candidate division KSB1 bacterium]MDZ7310424.1 CHAT domain-containing protein [candidate division KSB1 bacterium]
MIGFACSLAATLVIAVFVKWLSPTRTLTKSIDMAFYDIFFHPTLRPHPDLVILDCDDPHERLRRSDYARMIRQLHHAGAKWIAFDIRFVGEHEDDRQGDQALARSVAECPEVILSIDFAGDWSPSPHEMTPAIMRKLEHFARLALPEAACRNLLPMNIADRGVDLPYDSLFLVTQHVGYINSLISEYHHFPPVLTFQGNRKCYASLPVEIAQHYFKPPDSLFRMIEQNLDGDGQLLVNFIPVEEFQPFYYHYPWKDTTQYFQSNSHHYRDKIVLIVNPSAETPVQCPVGPYPRWAILASLVSQLLLNRPVEARVLSDPAFYSALLVFLGLIWLLFVTPRLAKKWRKTRWIFITGSLLFILLIFLLLNLNRQWLGLVVPLSAFNVSMLVVRAKYYRMMTAPQPNYKNLGVGILESQDGIYPIHVFESSVGEEEGNLTFQSFLEEENFLETLRKVRDLRASRDELEWMGTKLFNALFHEKVYNILKASIQDAKHEEKILRLQLRIDPAELICLPWELLRSAELPPGFMAFHKRISLTRYLKVEQPIPKRRFRIPLKILVVIAAPLDLPPLDVEREKKIIKKSLRPYRWAGDIRLRFCENATPEKLAEELKHHPHVLHFIGHGEFDVETSRAFLLLESETKERNQVDAETLAIMLQERSVNLVVLNSCETAAASSTNAFTGIAQNLVKVGVPAVVAMQHKILDVSALWFSKVFYPTLFRSNSIDAAVAEARHYIMTKTGLDHQDWAAPVLFMRAPDGKVFEIDS